MYATQCTCIFLYSHELTRLLNLNPDNLGACKTKERNFLPDMYEYFDEAIMQMDPEAKIEEEYKKVNEADFRWRALRLLAQRGPMFFPQTNTPTKISAFIEDNLKRITRDRPQNSIEEVKLQTVSTETEDGEQVDKIEEKREHNNCEENKSTKSELTGETMGKVARHVGENWKRLALKIGCRKKEIEIIAQEPGTNLDRALAVLRVCEGNLHLTPAKLADTLDGIGLIKAATCLREPFKD